MSDLLRYVVSINPASKAVKVEQIGEAGELTEVDSVSFVQSLGIGIAGASQSAQVVINVYAGGSPARLDASGTLPKTILGADPGPSSVPKTMRGVDPGPPPPPMNIPGADPGPSPPPLGKPGKPGKQ